MKFEPWARLGAGPPAESRLHVCRWSVMAYETKLPRPASSSTGTEDFSEGSEVFCCRALTPRPGTVSLARSPVLAASPTFW